MSLEEPNVLICYADKFWPPVATMEWRRNGAVVSEGVYDSVYYGRPDLLFRKFSYLPFVPQRGDVYSCAVRHWGAEGPVQRMWGEIMGCIWGLWGLYGVYMGGYGGLIGCMWGYGVCMGAVGGRGARPEDVG